MPFVLFNWKVKNRHEDTKAERSTKEIQYYFMYSRLGGKT